MKSLRHPTSNFIPADTRRLYNLESTPMHDAMLSQRCVPAGIVMPVSIS